MEGRMAARSFETVAWPGTFFTTLKSDPVIVTNQLTQNGAHMVDSTTLFDPQNKGNQIVANNVVKGINSGSLITDFPGLGTLDTLQEPTLKSNVSDRPAFKANKSKLVGATTKNGYDETSYFAAAKTQLQKISSFYATFTSEENPVSYNHDNVESVTVEDGTGANPVITVNLKAGYTEDYTNNPPLVFVNLSGKPKNLTIKINGQDTADEDVGEGNLTYKYSPYLILNWTKGVDFSDQASSKFQIIVKDLQNNVFTNAEDGQNKINKLVSGHILNNFPNQTEKFSFTGQDKNYFFSGTILTPNASLFTIENLGDGGNFFGNIITGGDLSIKNNITAERSLVSRFDADGLSTDTIEKLDPNNPDNQPDTGQQKLQTIQLKAGDYQTMVDGQRTSAIFDYDQVTQKLKGLPNSCISATMSFENDRPYRLFYRILTGSKKGKWHQYQSNLSGKTQTIPDLEALLFRDDDYRILPQEKGQVTSADDTFNYQLQRQNRIEFGVAPTSVSTGDLDTDGTQLSSQLTFDLIVQGSLRIVVPASLDLGRNNWEKLVLAKFGYR